MSPIPRDPAPAPRASDIRQPGDRRTASRRRRARAAIVAGGLVLALGFPALAQDADIRNLAEQIERLQQELGDLQRTVYAGAAPPAGAGGSGGSNLDASQEVRIQQMESQMSGLTGRIEEMSYELTRLSERVDQLAAAVGGLVRGETPMAESGQPAPADAPAATADAAPPAASGQPATPGQPAAPQTLQAQLEAAQAREGQSQGSAEAPVPAQSQTAAVPTAAYQLPGETPDEQYQYAFGLLRQANYPEAEQALTAFIERNPASPLAGNAQYWLGETHYVRGDYQSAAVAFAAGYEKYPDSGKAPDNLLKLGMSLGEIGAKDDACIALSQLAKQFPGAPANIKERAERERAHLGCG